MGDVLLLWVLRVAFIVIFSASFLGMNFGLKYGGSGNIIARFVAFFLSVSIAMVLVSNLFWGQSHGVWVIGKVIIFFLAPYFLVILTPLLFVINFPAAIAGYSLNWFLNRRGLLYCNRLELSEDQRIRFEFSHEIGEHFKMCFSVFFAGCCYGLLACELLILLINGKTPF